MKKIDEDTYITTGEDESLQVLTKTDEDLLERLKSDIFKI